MVNITHKHAGHGDRKIRTYKLETRASPHNLQPIRRHPHVWGISTPRQVCVQTNPSGLVRDHALKKLGDGCRLFVWFAGGLLDKCSGTACPVSDLLQPSWDGPSVPGSHRRPRPVARMACRAWGLGGSSLLGGTPPFWVVSQGNRPVQP